MGYPSNYFDDKTLYVLTGISDLPQLFSNGIILIYTQKSKAASHAQKFRNHVNNNLLKVTPIKDNSTFFASMVAHKLNKFLLDGEGEIHNCSDYCDLQKAEQLKTEIKANKTIIPKKEPLYKDVSDSSKRTSKVTLKLLLIPLIVFTVISLLSFNNSTNTSNYNNRTDLYATPYNPDTSNYYPNDYSPISPYVSSSLEVIFTSEKIFSYTTDLEYEKGTITDNVYHSDFINLYGRLPDGYEWMNTSELQNTLADSNRQIDYEVGVKDISDSSEIFVLFTVKLSESEEKYSITDILDETSSLFTLDNIESSTTIYTNRGIDDPYISSRRKYGTVCYSKGNIQRIFTYNKVNDRFVCIMHEYDTNPEMQDIRIFNEY